MLVSRHDWEISAFASIYSKLYKILTYTVSQKFNFKGFQGLLVKILCTLINIYILDNKVLEMII